MEVLFKQQEVCTCFFPGLNKSFSALTEFSNVCFSPMFGYVTIKRIDVVRLASSSSSLCV